MRVSHFGGPVYAVIDRGAARQRGSVATSDAIVWQATRPAAVGAGQLDMRCIFGHG
jgi:hypothetical protein